MYGTVINPTQVNRQKAAKVIIVRRAQELGKMTE